MLHDGALDAPQAPPVPHRKKIVVVGLGMVGISFMYVFGLFHLTNSEKLLKLDAKRREYDVVVIGEEPHLAYNRVGLTSFFEHRQVESLYLNPLDWYSKAGLSYHLNTLVTAIHPERKTVECSSGDVLSYDILVLATGSNAFLPTMVPGHDGAGVFVYRTIDDLQRLIEFSSMRKGTKSVVIGGGLLGLEAAKAMLDLEAYDRVSLIEKFPYLLGRQLDRDGAGLVAEKIQKLGIDLNLEKGLSKIDVDDSNSVTGITLDDGQHLDCSTVCFAVGVRPRDDLARRSGLKCGERGGIDVDDALRTSIDDIYAIGECASWNGMAYGLIAPGVEMADILSFNLTQAKLHAPRRFKAPDLSTKLKLLGVDVASFGDYFADTGPKKDDVQALTYRDPFQAIYKKFLFTKDGKRLVGGMMVGDTSDYMKLVPLAKSKKPLEVPPGELILGRKADDNTDDLDDDAQVCSCHNVTKGDLVCAVKDGCTSVGDVKSCTKAGTGCGGCLPLVTSIFNSQMKAMGNEVKNHLCPHFDFSRADLYNIISVKQLKTFPEVMRAAGNDAASLGCEVCKPCIGSILSSLFNRHIMDKQVHGLQDTNDRYLGNIQRNGTYSVIPRVPAGEITPDKLLLIASVAKKYNLYTKITGGQRIDMFGAKKQDLIAIWSELVGGGFESGHAYAKALRTVKSCVGTTWCRYGIGDSVGMAVRLEERYKSIRSPHKLKGGVSGCVRECAEAQNKDFGLIATEKGFNIFVGGNGGAKPRHSELLAKDVPPDEVIPILDRYLMFYIRTADKLQRTARWIEALPGGIDYLREVVVDDKLGICDSLEQQMRVLVDSFFDEWKEAIEDPERRKHFQQFGNTSETQETMEHAAERGQQRPVYWPKESVTEDFRSTEWSSLAWQPIIEASHFRDSDSPSGASANVKRGDTQLAVFKLRDKYYCTQQMCPHKRSFVLSDGLIGDLDNKLYVSCPNHKRNFELNGSSKGSCANDADLSIATFEAEERDGMVYVKLPPVDELDAVLGTKKWKLTKDSEATFEKLDSKLATMRGRRRPREEQKAIAVGCGSSIDW